MSRPTTGERVDRGSVLILALILVVVLGAVVAAVATYTATALRSSRVTTDIVDTLSAAESGMQYGLARADGDSCPVSVNDGPINGASVTTTCERAAIVENADGLYALVVTALGVSPARTALTLAGSSSEQNGIKRVSGPVYLGENMGTASLAAAAAVALDGASEVGGSVRFDVVGDCLPSSVSPAPAGAWAPPQPVVSCDSRGWQAISSRPDLSSDPLLQFPDLGRSTVFAGVDAYGTVARPLPTGPAGVCREFAPGWFDGSALSGGTLDLSEPTFFKSGVYYFENVVIDIGEQVAIGKRSDLPTPATPAAGPDFPPACQAQWDADGAGTGAVWILGGSSRIVGTKANVDFYPRQVARSNVGLGPVDMAIIQFEAGAAETWGYATESLNQDASNNQDAQKLLWRANGSQTDVSIYGMTYAPAGWIDMNNASSNAFVQFIGGVVAARVDIRIAANVPGFTISVPTVLTDYFLLETSATRDDLDTTVRTVSREGPTGLQVITWRVK